MRHFDTLTGDERRALLEHVVARGVEAVADEAGTSVATVSNALIGRTVQRLTGRSLRAIAANRVAA